MMARSNVDFRRNYPLELHYIKALFLQKQYRLCIQACHNVLNAAGDGLATDAVKATFVSFYLGLAHEELARLVHDYSNAKVTACTKAEGFYKDALASLPAIAARHQDVIDDPFFDSSPSQLKARPANPAPAEKDDDQDDMFNYNSPSYPQMPPISPPGYVCSAKDDSMRSLPSRSLQTSTRETSSSSLGSDESFSQILTPNRVLRRDYSKMSLLPDRQKAPSTISTCVGLITTSDRALQRDVSRMSLVNEAPKRPSSNTPLPRTNSSVTGLMRPIVPGTPVKSLFVPHELPYVRSASAINSRLPKLVTRDVQTFPLPKTPKAIFRKELEGEEWSPTSPESSLDSDPAASDANTISPISPGKPDWDIVARAVRTHAPFSPPQQEAEKNSLSEHIEAMRIQLETHLRLLANVKDRTVTAQATRAAERASTVTTRSTPLAPFRASLNSAHSTSGVSRPGSSSSSKHDSLLSSPDGAIGGLGAGSGKKMVRDRSFWLFTPEDQKKAELRKRIEKGRERGWSMQRFQPQQYRELAENALAEL